MPNIKLEPTKPGEGSLELSYAWRSRRNMFGPDIKALYLGDIRAFSVVLAIGSKGKPLSWVITSSLPGFKEETLQVKYDSEERAMRRAEAMLKVWLGWIAAAKE